MPRPSVRLSFRDDAQPALRRRSVTFKGGAAEFVEIDGPCAFDYDRGGAQHYMAIYDFVLKDGETSDGGAPTPTPRDLRGRMSFVPGRGRVSGWSSLAPRRNSYTTLTWSPDLVESETERTPRAAPQRLPYFHHAGLAATLRKVDAALRAPAIDRLLVETLGLLAAVEMDRLQAQAPRLNETASGQLSPARERLVAEFIEERLAQSISLAELAGLTGLSRFHFSRAFKASFGASPLQYVLVRRVERAKMLLRDGALLVAGVGKAVGYDDPGRFATLFREHTGRSPTEYRREIRL